MQVMTPSLIPMSWPRIVSAAFAFWHEHRVTTKPEKWFAHNNTISHHQIELHRFTRSAGSLQSKS
jgi:hypothetical protein